MARLKIACIGYGAVATVLCDLISEHPDYVLSTIVVRNLATFTPSEKLSQQATYTVSTDLNEISQCDCILLAVNDEQIAKVAAQISDIHFSVTPTLIHFSGLYASSVFSSCAGKHGSIHPLYSFNQSMQQDLKNQFFVYEGDAEALAIILPLIEENEIKLVSIASKHKEYYYAAVATSMSLPSYLADISKQLFTQAGMSADVADPLSRFLVSQAASQLLKQTSTEAALCGPIARNETATLDKLATIAGVNEIFSSIQNFYDMQCNAKEEEVEYAD